MRTTSYLLITALLLCGCGDDSTDPGPASMGGSGGEAGALAEAGPDGQAGAAGQPGEDAQAEEGSTSDGPADSPSEETAAAECKSLALTQEERTLIESGDATTPMTIVTNATPEGDAFLHQIACPIDPKDPTVLLLIERMRVTLAATGSGVGLAGPQVGISRRLFLAERGDLTGSPVDALLNPKITAYSPETWASAEGCLSVPGKQPKVKRSLWVTVDYVRDDGTEVVGETIGSTTNATEQFSARIVQHEYDHLDGILIVDK
ncbi:MAG: peptide deformylase [Deltaproteobacteria bacterium]|nr:peptide deformylase [Deltaproteobacteria bacterium]